MIWDEVMPQKGSFWRSPSLAQNCAAGSGLDGSLPKQARCQFYPCLYGDACDEFEDAISRRDMSPKARSVAYAGRRITSGFWLPLDRRPGDFQF